MRATLLCQSEQKCYLRSLKYCVDHSIILQTTFVISGCVQSQWPKWPFEWMHVCCCNVNVFVLARGTVPVLPNFIACMREISWHLTMGRPAYVYSAAQVKWIETYSCLRSCWIKWRKTPESVMTSERNIYWFLVPIVKTRKLCIIHFEVPASSGNEQRNISVVRLVSYLFSIIQSG